MASSRFPRRRNTSEFSFVCERKRSVKTSMNVCDRVLAVASHLGVGRNIKNELLDGKHSFSESSGACYRNNLESMIAAQKVNNHGTGGSKCDGLKFVDVWPNDLKKDGYQEPEDESFNSSEMVVLDTVKAYQTLELVDEDYQMHIDSLMEVGSQDGSGESTETAGDVPPELIDESYQLYLDFFLKGVKEDNADQQIQAAGDSYAEVVDESYRMFLGLLAKDDSKKDGGGNQIQTEEYLRSELPDESYKIYLRWLEKNGNSIMDLVDESLLLTTTNLEEHDEMVSFYSPRNLHFSHKLVSCIFHQVGSSGVTQADGYLISELVDESYQKYLTMMKSGDKRIADIDNDEAKFQNCKHFMPPSTDESMNSNEQKHIFIDADVFELDSASHLHSSNVPLIIIDANEEQAPMKKQYPEGKGVREYVMRAFDEDELNARLQLFRHRTPVVGRRELRSGCRTYKSSTYGSSYEDLYQDLAELIRSTSQKRLILRYLRGFFYWLQNVAHGNLLPPWKDPQFLKMAMNDT